MSELKTLIMDALTEVVEKRKAPASVAEVREVLRNKYGVMKSEKWIRLMLERLALEGSVKKIPVNRAVYYFPLKTRYKQATLDAFVKVCETITLEEAGNKSHQEHVKKLLRRAEEVAETTFSTLSGEVGKSIYLSKFDIDSKLINIVANELAREDPKKLLFDMFIDLIRLFEKHAEQYKKAQSSLEKRKIIEKLERIRTYIILVYGDALGIPVSSSASRGLGKLEVLRIRLPDKRTGEYILEYNLDTLKRFLDARIPDDTFIVIEKANKRETHEIFTGIDSSTTKVEISIPRVTRRGTYFYVNTVVSWSDVQQKGGGELNESSKPIIFPRPESIEKLDYKTAEEEGYIISPHTLSMLPEYYHDRIREAQMNYLEHKFATKIAMVDPSERDIYEILKKPPDIIFLDGRVFPYEHKLDDYVALHRRFVKKSVSAFVSLINQVEARRNEISVVGVVKRGHFAYLRPIVLWYLFKKGLISEEHFLGDKHNILLLALQLISDAKLAFMLLRKFYNPDSDFVPRTFAVIRRFYAMDQRLLRGLGRAEDLSVENETTFWFSEVVISEDLPNKGLAGFVEEHDCDKNEAWPYAEACAKGAVAMFYYLPSGLDRKKLEENKDNILIPRYEVLLPPSYISEKEPEKRKKMIRECISRVIINGREERGFYVGYEDMQELSEGGKQRILLVPKHIKYAHYYAKNFEGELSKVYGYYIMSKAIDVLCKLEEVFGEIGS